MKRISWSRRVLAGTVLVPFSLLCMEGPLFAETARLARVKADAIRLAAQRLKLDEAWVKDPQAYEAAHRGDAEKLRAQWQARSIRPVQKGVSELEIAERKARAAARAPGLVRLSKDVAAAQRLLKGIASGEAVNADRVRQLKSAIDVGAVLLREDIDWQLHTPGEDSVAADGFGAHVLPRLESLQQELAGLLTARYARTGALRALEVFDGPAANRLGDRPIVAKTDGTGPGIGAHVAEPLRKDPAFTPEEYWKTSALELRADDAELPAFRAHVAEEAARSLVLVPREPDFLPPDTAGVGMAMLFPGFLDAAPPGNPVPADLVFSEETPDVPELRALAAELSGAPEVFAWVLNNVDTELYRGVRRGAFGTYIDRAGNDFDQAALLVTLLRMKGISARFEVGTISLTTEQAAALTRTQTAVASSIAFNSSGVPARVARFSDGTSTVLVEHAYVRAYVPYSVYRGAPGTAGREAWIDLDPSFKPFRVTPPVVDVAGSITFDETAYLENANLATPLTTYQRSAWSAIRATGNPCPTLADARVRRTVAVVPTEPGMPNVLPYKIEARLATFAAVPSNQKARVSVVVRDPGGGEFATHSSTGAALQGRVLALRFVGATAADQTSIDEVAGDISRVNPQRVRVRPQLYVDDVVAGTSTGSMALGIDFAIDVTLTQPGFEPDTLTHDQFVTGGFHVIATSMGHASEASLARLEGVRQARQSAGASDALVEEAELALTGAQYFQQLVAAGDDFLGLNGLAFSMEPAEALITRKIEPTTFFGFVRSVRYVGFNIDAARFRVFPYGPTGENALAYQLTDLWGLHGSALEHRIWEQRRGGAGVSAVKALQLAAATGQAIHRVQDAGGLGVLAQATISDDAKERIRRYVEAGYTAYFHRDPVNDGRWRGAGYILRHPGAHVGLYLIDGGTNGGDWMDFPPLGVMIGENWTCPQPPSIPTTCPVSGNIVGRVFACSMGGMGGSGPGIGGGGGTPGPSNFPGPPGEDRPLTDGEGDDPGDTPPGMLPDGGIPGFLPGDPGNGNADGCEAQPAHPICRAQLPDGTWSLTAEAAAITPPMACGTCSEPGGTVGCGISAEIDAHLDVTRSLDHIVFFDGNRPPIIFRHLAANTWHGPRGGAQFLNATETGWTLVQGNNKELHFDCNGRLISRNDLLTPLEVIRSMITGCVERIENPETSEVLYTVNAHAGGSLITAASGRTVTVEVDRAACTRVDVTDSEAGRWRWDLGVAGRVSRFEEPGGPAWQMAYDESGRVVAITQPDGAQMTFLHDVFNRQTVFTDAAGRKRLYRYAVDGTVTSITDVAGTVTRYNATGDGKVGNVVKNGVVAEQLERNERGQPVKSTSVDGAESLYQRDDQGRLMGVSSSTGKQTLVERDAMGRVTAIHGGSGETFDVVSDDRGLITGLSSPTDGAFTASFDAVGNTVEVTDSERGTFRRLTDDDGNVVRVETPEVAINMVPGPRGQIAQLEVEGLPPLTMEYDAAGNKISETDERGRTSTYEHDAMGRMTSMTMPHGGTTRLAYNGLGQVTSVTDPLGNRWQKVFDERGNVAAVQRPDGTTVGAAYCADEGALCTNCEDEGPLAQACAMVDPDGVSTESLRTPTGKLAEERTGSRVQRRYQYDDAGRVVAWVDGKGGRTTFEYDAAGSVVASVDALHNRWEFGHNGMGDRVSTTDPLGRITSYELDYTGQVRRRTTSDSRVDVWDYALNGEVTGRTYADGTSTTITLFADGTPGAITHSDGRVYNIDRALDGHVTGERGPDGNLTQLYDSASMRTGSRLEGPGASLELRYDLAEQPVGYVDHRGFGVHWRLSAVGLTREIEVDGLGRVDVRRTPGGRLAGYRYPNGVTQDLLYDDTGLVRAVMVRGGDGNILWSESYERDANGNLALRRSHDGRVTQWTYDALDRVVGRADPDGAQTTFTYDALGNRLTQTDAGGTTTYSYDNALRLTREARGTDVTDYRYDGRGNLVEKQRGAAIERFAYSTNNLLLQHTTPGGAVTRYGYDSGGRRIWKESGGQRTYELYLGHALALMTDAAGSPTTRFVVDAGAATPIAMWRNGEWQMLHSDVRGDVRVVTGSAGQVVATSTLDDFGSPLGGAPLPTPLGLVGMPFDSESGLSVHGLRRMDGRLGRFVAEEPDPLPSSESGRVNLYQYPLNPFDVKDVDGRGPAQIESTFNEWKKGLEKTSLGIQIITFDIIRWTAIRAMLPVIYYYTKIYVATTWVTEDTGFMCLYARHMGLIAGMITALIEADHTYDGMLAAREKYMKPTAAAGQAVEDSGICHGFPCPQDPCQGIGEVGAATLNAIKGAAPSQSLKVTAYLMARVFSGAVHTFTDCVKERK